MKTVVLPLPASPTMAICMGRDGTPGRPVGGGPSAADGIIDAEAELLDPENAKEIYGAVGAAWTHEIEAECASAGDGGIFSASECKVLGGMTPGDQKEYYEWKKGNVNYDCAGPEDCDSSCTSYNEQVMERMEECTQQEIDAARPDVGPLDPVINPSPDDPGAGGLPDDPLLSCLIATADGGRDVNLACGFVTGSDTRATAMSASEKSDS